MRRAVGRVLDGFAPKFYASFTINFQYMTHLTEERFEEILTEKLSPLATKEQIEDLARMTSRGFEDVLERLDVRERMARVEQNLQLIATELHITLQK
jgi:hypothetical protein